MPWEEEGQQGQGPAAGDQGNGQGTGAEGQQEQGQQSQEQGQQGQQGDQGGQQNDAAKVAQTMRQELNQIKQQNQLLQQQVQFYQANMGQGMPQGQQGRQGQQAQDPFADLEEDDVVDVPTMKRIFNQFQQTTSQQLREIQLRAQYPDIEQTIQTYLPNALNKNPSLQQALRQSGDPLLAYQIASYEKQLQDGANGQGQGDGQGQDQGQQTTQRILDNLNKPQNPGATGGGGSGVDAADAYLNMSDEDLEKRIAQVKGG